MNAITIIGLTSILLLGILYIMLSIAFKNFNRVKKKSLPKKFLYQRQSTIHNILQPFLPSNEDLVRFLKHRNRQDAKQSKNSYEDKTIKVAVVGNMAYWVQGNIFYQAPIDEQGEINHSVAIPVDATNMTEEEVENLMQILDDIGSMGKNDNGSSGHE